MEFVFMVLFGIAFLVLRGLLGENLGVGCGLLAMYAVIGMLFLAMIVGLASSVFG